MIKLKNILLEDNKSMPPDDGYHRIYKTLESKTKYWDSHPVEFVHSNTKRWVLTWNFTNNGFSPADDMTYAAEIKPIFDSSEPGSVTASKAMLIIYLPKGYGKNPGMFADMAKLIKPSNEFYDVYAAGYEHKIFIINTSNVSKAAQIINTLGGNYNPALSEGYAWERKADGSLPTLKDVQEAYDAKDVEDAADEVKESSKPDFLDLDKDGDKEEPMKKAAKEVNEEETEEESDHVADTVAADMDVLNMGSLEETFWSRVKGNLHGHEYILKEAFKK